MLTEQKKLNAEIFTDFPKLSDCISEPIKQSGKNISVFDLETGLSEKYNIDEIDVILENKPIVLGYIFIAMFFYASGLASAALFMWLLK